MQLILLVLKLKTQVNDEFYYCVSDAIMLRRNSVACVCKQFAQKKLFDLQLWTYADFYNIQWIQINYSSPI